MDSRSGPESSSKVHAFGEAVKRPFGKPLETLAGCMLMWGTSAVALAGCMPDLRQPEAALGLIARGCASNDAKVMFPAMDAESRHALEGTMQARKQALALIEGSYPEEARAEAKAQLGDAGRAENAASLFALRCAEDCLAELCRGVGAPSSQQSEGKRLRVRTVRGGEYLLARDPKTQEYGFVWRTEDAVRERRRAFAELSSIKNNAAVYDKQRALR